MADKAYDVKFVLSAIDNASTQLLGVGAAATTLGDLASKAFMAVKNAVVGSFKDIVNAGIDAERIDNSLAQTLKMTGQYTKENVESLNDYAAALQELTGTTGDEIKSAETILATYGFTTAEIKLLTKAALDLTSTGMNLKSATDLLGKSVGTNINAMSRYGISIDGVAGSSGRVLSAIDGVDKLLKDRAIIDTDNTAGAMKKLKASMDDLYQAIGVTLTPSIKKLAEYIQDKVKISIEDVNKTTNSLIKVFETLTDIMLFIIDVVEGIYQEFKRFIDQAEGVSKAVVAVGHLFKAMFTSFKEDSTQAEEEYDKFVDGISSSVDIIKDSYNDTTTAYKEAIDARQVLADAEQEKEKLRLDVNNQDYTSYAAQRKMTEEIMANDIKVINDNMVENKRQAEITIANEIKNIVLDLASTRRDTEKKVLNDITVMRTKSWKELLLNFGKLKDNIVALENKMVANLTTTMFDALTQLEKGFVDFTDLLSSMGNAIKQAFIMVIAEMTAKWIAGLALMAAKSLIFKMIEIAKAAAIGAANAAAAMSWTLFAAIPIGLAVGAAIMKLAGAFAGGKENFAGGYALVGEKGAEIVNLPTGSSVYSNNQSRDLLSRVSSGATININITGNTIMGKQGMEDVANDVGNIIMSRIRLERII